MIISSDIFIPTRNLSEQSEHDGPLTVICDHIRKWMSNEPDVEKVAVTHGAGNYTVAILANPLTMKIMRHLQGSFGAMFSKLDIFGDHYPHVYVMGPKQREAGMMHSPLCSVCRS